MWQLKDVQITCRQIAYYKRVNINRPGIRGAPGTVLGCVQFTSFCLSVSYAVCCWITNFVNFVKTYYTTNKFVLNSIIFFFFTPN